MKKFISLLLCVLLLTGTAAPFASNAQYDETIYLDDGSYLKFSVKDAYSIEQESASMSFIEKIIEWIKAIFSLFKKEKTVSKAKYTEYYSSNGELLWKVYLKAAFTYDGKTAVCTSSNIYYEIYDRDWSLESSSAKKIENTATGTFTVKQHKLGVPLKEISKTLTLTCDKNGNVK